MLKTCKSLTDRLLEQKKQAANGNGGDGKQQENVENGPVLSGCIELAVELKQCVLPPGDPKKTAQTRQKHQRFIDGYKGRRKARFYQQDANQNGRAELQDLKDLQGVYFVCISQLG